MFLRYRPRSGARKIYDLSLSLQHLLVHKRSTIMCISEGTRDIPHEVIPFLFPEIPDAPQFIKAWHTEQK